MLHSCRRLTSGEDGPRVRKVSEGPSPFVMMMGSTRSSRGESISESVSLMREIFEDAADDQPAAGGNRMDVRERRSMRLPGAAAAAGVGKRWVFKDYFSVFSSHF